MSSQHQGVPRGRRSLLITVVGLAVVALVGAGIWFLSGRVSPNSAPAPTSTVTVAPPTADPTAAPPTMPIRPATDQRTMPAEGPVPTDPEAVVTRTVPGYQTGPATDAAGPLAESALAARTATYSRADRPVEVTATQWASPAEAAAYAEQLRTAAAQQAPLLRTGGFGANGEGTFWHYEQAEATTIVWQRGDMSGTLVGNMWVVTDLLLQLMN